MEIKAILLAAGRGKRLQPLTDRTPKPLLKIGDRPILEWILLSLRSAGITQIAIITGHLGEQIKNFFRTGDHLGLSLSYFQQLAYDGTGHAVLPARDYLGGNSFFLGYGDIFTHPDNYAAVLRTFQTHRTESVLGVWPVEDPSIGGAVELEGPYLKSLVEKAPQGMAPSNLINAGLMVFHPSIWNRIDELTPSKRGEYELTDAILGLSKSERVRIHILESFWSDIGTKEKLAEANAYIGKTIFGFSAQNRQTFQI